MSKDVAIKIDHVSKTFKLPHEKQTSLKGATINYFRGRSRSFETQQVLDDVTFEIKKGEFFGIVGRNGSGKSTLLKMLAGIYTPSGGTIEVNGQLTPFIELGVGFNQELTGRENVFLNGALLGFSRKEMHAMYHDIVAFAEIEKFMDQKLKNYSSGMQVRLAFSIAIRANTEILLVDEVLAVGDAIFQQKCYDYFQDLKDSKRTVVFVTHDMGAIQSFCDRAVIIDSSKLVFEGEPYEVAAKYSEILAPSSSKPLPENTSYQHTGVGGAEIVKAEILDTQDRVIQKVSEGQDFKIRVHYSSSKPIEEPVFGVGIMGQNNESIVGPNTKDSGITIKTLAKRGYFEAKFSNLPLSTGIYRIRAGIFNKSVTIPYDFVEKLITLNVTGKKRYGDVYVEPEWSFHE
jgi:ABC-2 type transport system ATP-binding protein